MHSYLEVGTMDQERNDHITIMSIRPPPLWNTSDRNMMHVARYEEKHPKIEEGTTIILFIISTWVSVRASIHSESSGSKKSNSDYSVLRQHPPMRSNSCIEQMKLYGGLCHADMAVVYHTCTQAGNSPMHVPKFGNCDSKNIAWSTTYFENARKEKGTGVKKLNPNDPEENPNAFVFGIMDQESNDNHNYHHVNRPPSSRNTSG